MSLRRLLSALLVVPALLLLGACSGDDEGSATTTTEDSGPSSGDQPSTSDSAPTTVTDEAFASQVAQARAAIEAADGDLCKLLDATTLTAIPTTSDQMKDQVALSRDALVSVADAVDGDDPESAAALRAAATALVEHAEATGYPPDLFADEEGLPEELTGQAFADAGLAMQERYTTECTDGGTGAENGEDAG